MISNQSCSLVQIKICIHCYRLVSVMQHSHLFFSLRENRRQGISAILFLTAVGVNLSTKLPGASPVNCGSLLLSLVHVQAFSRYLTRSYYRKPPHQKQERVVQLANHSNTSHPLNKAICFYPPHR